MKRTLGILMTAIATVMAVFVMTGCAGTQTQIDVDRLTEKVTELTDSVSDLSAENEALKDSVSDLSAENEALKDSIDGLNVFRTDKAEYVANETMTVYLKNQPVLKIRLHLDNIWSALWWAGDKTINSYIYLTSLCGNIYAESMLSTSFVVWDNGAYARRQDSSLTLTKQNQETLIIGQFDGSGEAYTNATWFDLVICVPGTPFELARFKDVTIYDP